MISCSYCKTENTNKTYSCTFCKAPLNFERPKQKEFLSLDHAQKPFLELTEYHTYDLLVLLRMVRSERSTAYDSMISFKRLLNKAPESTQMDADNQTLLRHAEDDYKHHTARMNVLEGILIDRMGYKPKRIDDKLLNALSAKMNSY